MSRGSTPDRGWFYWREARPGLWLIAEPGLVYSWLVVGSERACLLDTGSGIAPIRPIVESITSLPVVVVNSHYHFDHVGGNHEYDSVAIHHLGADLLDNPQRAKTVDALVGVLQSWSGDVAAFRELDANLFSLLTVELDPRPLPPGAADRVRAVPVAQPDVRQLSDGDQLDLGDRTLRVLHTPGHSPDGISLLDERDGVLLAADAFNLGIVYCHFFDSDVASLRQTAERLASLSGDVSYVTTHHYPRVIGEPSLLLEYRDALSRIDETEKAPTMDLLGQPCLRASFDQVAITVPDPSQPPAMIG